MWIKLKIVLLLKQRQNKLELLSPEVIKLLGSTKKHVVQNKDSENVQEIQFVEVVLLDCN